MSTDAPAELTYAEQDGGFSLVLDRQLSWLANLKTIPVPGRGVDNAAEALALLACIVPWMLAMPAIAGVAPLMGFVGVLIAYVVLKWAIDRFVDDSPLSEIEVARGRLNVHDRTGATVWSAPLEAIQARHNGGVLELAEGAETHSIRTTSDASTMDWVVQRIAQAQAAHGQPSEVPEALRAARARQSE